MTVLFEKPPALDADERAQRRTHAREILGVVGKAEPEPLRPVLKEYGLTFYPVAALGLLGFVDTFQSEVLVVLTPEVSRTLGISLGAIAAARGLQGLAASAAPLPMAALSQRKGSRAMLCLVTALVWSVITLTTGFVTGLLALIAVLVVDGLSTGSVAALHPPLLADIYPPRARLRVLSGYTGTKVVGSILSPLLVGLLAGPFNLSWRGVFLALGFISTGGSLLALGLRDPGPGKWDTESLRHESGAVPDTSDTDLGFFEIARRLMLIPTVQRLSTGFLVFGILSIPFATFLSSFLQDRWNLQPTGRAIFFAVVNGVAVIGLKFYSRIAENDFRTDPARVIDRVALALGAGVVFTAIGATMPVYVLMVAFFALGQTAFTLLVPGLNGVMLSIVDARYRPHLAALIGMFTALGGIVGALLLSGVNDEYGLAGSIISLLVPGIGGALIIRSAKHLVVRDFDGMIDSILEEQDLAELRAAGGRPPMLSSRGLNFSYGQLQVLFDVDFSVDEGEMVALLGTNGAGKSTLLKVISGIGLPSSGTVRMGGQDITYLDAERRLRLGITQIPGGRAVFGPMTVIDNLRGFGFTLGANKRTVEEAIERCLAAFPRLDERKTSLAATLSGGEQQMLGLSKALMLKPKLLLIDELSLGLAPVIVGQLLDMVRAINAEGTAVVLVEQSVNIALSLVDHAYFMEKGQMRFDGSADDLLGRDDLLRAVFLEGATKGAEAAATKPARRPKAARAVKGQAK